MSIRTRLAVLVAAVAVALGAAAFVVQRLVLSPGFLDLERRAVADDLARSAGALRSELLHLGLLAQAWASRDDVNALARNGHDPREADHLMAGSMADVDVQCLRIVDADGRVVLAAAHDPEVESPTSFAELPTDRFPPDHPLLSPPTDAAAATGILRTAHGPLLLAGAPLATPGRRGASSGWLVLGRRLSPTLLARMAHDTRVAFAVLAADDPGLDAASREAIRRLPTGDAQVLREDGTPRLRAYERLDDVYGRPAYLMRVETPGDVLVQGTRTMDLAAASMLLAGAGIVGALFLALSSVVVAPLRRLTAHATLIGASGDLSTRSGVVRPDEIGRLARAFDEMVERLAESRGQLSDASRRAGMADVARSVLHNVGNVLTGVNVASAGLVAELRRSRLGGLLRGIDLLESHRHDLAPFLCDDERGRLLPDYLATAGAAVREEHERLAADADRLKRGVEAAVEIVSRQGDHANAPPVREDVTLGALLSAAAGLVQARYERDRVHLDVRVEEDVPLNVDRAKTLQILVNLLANAEEAVLRRAPGDRRVSLVGEVRDGRLLLAVEDNGCGFDAATGGRIFETGFSTKGPGRGLGLHYCAVAAHELGGSMAAHSDGGGRGARMTLELPATSTPAARRPTGRALAATGTDA